jgi:hypothetical protein
VFGDRNNAVRVENHELGENPVHSASKCGSRVLLPVRSREPCLHEGASDALPRLDPCDSFPYGDNFSSAIRQRHERKSQTTAVAAFGYYQVAEIERSRSNADENLSRTRCGFGSLDESDGINAVSLRKLTDLHVRSLSSRGVAWRGALSRTLNTGFQYTPVASMAA